MRDDDDKDNEEGQSGKLLCSSGVLVRALDVPSRSLALICKSVEPSLMPAPRVLWGHASQNIVLVLTSL